MSDNLSPYLIALKFTEHVSCALGEESGNLDSLTLATAGLKSHAFLGRAMHNSGPHIELSQLGTEHRLVDLIGG